MGIDIHIHTTSEFFVTALCKLLILKSKQCCMYCFSRVLKLSDRNYGFHQLINYTILFHSFKIKGSAKILFLFFVTVRFAICLNFLKDSTEYCCNRYFSSGFLNTSEILWCSNYGGYFLDYFLTFKKGIASKLYLVN